MAWNSQIQSMGPDELHNYCMTAERDELVENIGGITARLCALLPVDFDADKKNLDERFEAIEKKIEEALKPIQIKDRLHPVELADRPLDIFQYINATEVIVARYYADVIDCALKGDIDEAKKRLEGVGVKMTAIKGMRSRLDELCKTAEMYVEQRDPNRDDLPF